jgi:hypothetical protein
MNEVSPEDEAYLRSWIFYLPVRTPEMWKMLDGPDLARGQLPEVLSGNLSPDGGNPEGAK